MQILYPEDDDVILTVGKLPTVRVNVAGITELTQPLAPVARRV